MSELVAGLCFSQEQLELVGARQKHLLHCVLLMEIDTVDDALVSKKRPLLATKRSFLRTLLPVASCS